MAYAIHRHPHRHLTVHEQHHTSVADNGWWKFALVAAIMTALALVLVTSPVLRHTQSSQTVLTATTPAVVFLPPEITDLNPVASEPLSTISSAAAAAPVQANLAPVAANDTTRVATVASDPQTATSIRDVNFAALPSLQALASQVGGQVDPTQIKYADLTGDGSDEAVVPISSDGTAGNLALVVFTERSGSPAIILTRQATRDQQGLTPTFDGGQLSVTSAVFGPADANCCPSQIVRTYFRWDGTNLVVDHSNTITIPQGKQAD